MYALKSSKFTGPYLVCSIISRPYAVVEDDISKQGILPITAPVKPYTLFALTWPQTRPCISASESRFCLLHGTRMFNLRARQSHEL